MRSVLLIVVFLAASQAFQQPAKLFRPSPVLTPSYASPTIAQSRRRPSSKLTSTITLDPSTLRAGLGLVISAAVGRATDRVWSGSGILSTIGMGWFLSYLHMVPAHHGLYGAAWTTFLPASLVLLLLSLKDSPVKWSDTIPRVGVLFALAALGSVAGCVLAMPLLPSTDAAMAAACLMASFVGGSVNLLATADWLRVPSRIVTSLATADLAVMGVYFALLSMLLNSKTLNRFFGDSPAPERSDEVASNTTPMSQNILSSVQASILAYGVTRLARWAEGQMSSVVPGMACAVICLVTPLIKQLFRGSSFATKSLSEFTFLLVFAAIGMTANLQTVLQNAPAYLVYSLVAVMIHLGVVLGGSKILKLLFPQVRLSEALVASNAAIGGPATAVSFCNQAGGHLTTAATVWGVVGYGLGTTLGVTAYRMLLRA